MPNLSFWISLAVFVLVFAVLVELAIGMRKIGELRAMPFSPDADPPKVSIIVSALNEAGTIEPALRSLLALDYPKLEIIAIDDRSTDATPEILDRIAAGEPRLRVLHIRDLPPGWLGKNHALQRGAEIAGGDYLLFTDADVVFDKTAIARAVAYCEQHRIDHLTMLFDVIVNDNLLGMLLTSVGIGFMSFYKPWKVVEPGKYFFGVGAFNLVRAEAYRNMGGHAAIPLAVVDDMMLGKLLKRAGNRQQVLLGKDLLRLEWYADATEMMRGLEKNIFAGLDYSIGKLLAATLAILLMRVWPWIGLFATSGATRWLNAATILLGLSIYAASIRSNGWRLRSMLYAPFISLIELWMWWRACALAHLRGGIVWRGTHYALDVLKRAHRENI